MTTSAQLNIGNMGSAGTATRARGDMTSGADAARPGKQREDAGHSFDAALQKASKHTETRTNRHEAKEGGSKDDVAGRGKDLPDDKVAKAGEEGRSSTDNDGGQDTASTASDNSNGKEAAGEHRPDNSQENTRENTQDTTEVVATTPPPDGSVIAPVSQPETVAVPRATQQALTTTATDDASKVLTSAATVQGAVGSASGTRVPAAVGDIGMDPGAVSSPVSGKDSTGGVQGLMSFLRPGTEATAADQVKAALNQVLGGGDQSASGARGDGGNIALSAVTTNPVSALTPVQGQGGLLNPTPAPAGTVATPQVSTAFGQPQWADDVGQQLQWMASQNIQRADLKLNPAHLGPIDVRIVMHHDQVQVQMTATHAQVKDALETALPRLREGLEAGGFGQASVDVGQQGFGEARAEGDNDFQGSASGSGDGEDDTLTASIADLPGVRAAGVGLVDHYA